MELSDKNVISLLAMISQTQVHPAVYEDSSRLQANRRHGFASFRILFTRDYL